MVWIESQINDESIFPVTVDVPFPKTFAPVCKKILTRLYRVFVHVYVHHFDRLMAIGAEPHVNTCYKHFYYFVTEFGLLNDKVSRHKWVLQGSMGISNLRQNNALETLRSSDKLYF